MRIALVHDSLNPCGGSERLALAFAKALKEQGHIVDLFVFEPTEWEIVEKRTHISRGVIDHEYVIFSLINLLSLKTAYSKFPLWFLRDVAWINKIRSMGYDLVIVTKQLLIPVFADILYMHFPNFTTKYYCLYYSEKCFKTWYRIYLQPLELFLKPLLSWSKSSEYKPLILTNSKFSALMIWKFLGMKSMVLYPPIEIEKYLPLSQIKERKNIIITISRIEPLKNLELVIDIAKEVKTSKFIIAGTVGSAKYYINLKKKIKTLGLEDRVVILPNIDEETKMTLLESAKIYLHTMKYEHFGIAVIEAMASGLIPIVHKCGGPWLDIVEYGKYGFGFKNVEEAIEHINSLLEMREDEIQSWRLKLHEKVRNFSYDVFKRKVEHLINVLSKFLKEKNK